MSHILFIVHRLAGEATRKMTDFRRKKKQMAGGHRGREVGPTWDYRVSDFDALSNGGYCGMEPAPRYLDKRLGIDGRRAFVTRMEKAPFAISTRFRTPGADRVPDVSIPMISRYLRNFASKRVQRLARGETEARRQWSFGNLAKPEYAATSCHMTKSLSCEMFG